MVIIILPDRFLDMGSVIKLYNPQNTTNDIYATSIHELAYPEFRIRLHMLLTGE